GVGGDLGACCAALAQNAQSAPLEQKGYYLAAVGVCNSMKGSSDARSALGAISAALKGAGMPPICR
ncbi:MAG: acyltransferase, partial [Polyangiaceae bacterium]|nr:acyltransferase [Polyangiaceae bacterium]